MALPDEEVDRVAEVRGAEEAEAVLVVAAGPEEAFGVDEGAGVASVVPAVDLRLLAVVLLVLVEGRLHPMGRPGKDIMWPLPFLIKIMIPLLVAGLYSSVV